MFFPNMNENKIRKQRPSVFRRPRVPQKNLDRRIISIFHIQQSDAVFIICLNKIKYTLRFHLNELVRQQLAIAQRGTREKCIFL